MTARVIGPNGETPFTLGAVGIGFIWESSNPIVASVVPIYKEGSPFHLLAHEAQLIFLAWQLVFLWKKNTPSPFVFKQIRQVPPESACLLTALRYTATLTTRCSEVIILSSPIWTQAWTAMLQIEVVNGLVLLTQSELLLPFHSQFLIRTNKDSTAKLRYLFLSQRPTAAECQQILTFGHVGLGHMSSNTADQVRPTGLVFISVLM